MALAWASSAHAEPAIADATAFEDLARRCAPSVHPRTLAAVVKNESGFNPLAIGVNKGARLPRQPESLASAIATAKHLEAKGYNFDSGLGQINSVNVRKFNLSWPEVFDACTNLRAAARVLTECYERASANNPDEQSALRAALSCYNTGSFTRGFGNGYVAKVERAAGSSPAAVVPAIALVGEPVPVAGTPPLEHVPPAPPVAPDAFGRDRGGAFARASKRAQQALAMESDVASRDTSPLVLEAEPIRASQSGGFK